MSEGTHRRTIRAYVAREALGKVTRMFDGSTHTQARELLQNARRAGATRVDVELTSDPNDGTRHRTSIADDGTGIADPALLLAFGKSAWDASVAREDPAGLGLLALSRERVHIEWTTRGAEGALETCSVRLGPEHFAGEDEAQVHTHTPAQATGTRITWSGAGEANGAAHTWRNAARYAPLEVHVNGERVRREDFLKGAKSRSTWRGARIGVFEGRPEGRSGCWLGLEVGLGMDSIFTADGAQWWACVEASGYEPGLSLVLPERLRLIETQALKELRAAARTAVLVAMIADAKDAGKPLRLNRREFDYATRAGAAPPEPPRALVAFDLDDAVDDEMSGVWGTVSGPWDALPESGPAGWIVSPWDNAEERAETAQLAFAHAMGWAQMPPLWHECPTLEGYPWYDALAHIEQVEPIVVRGETSEPLHALYRDGRFEGGAVEGTLALEVTLVRQAPRGEGPRSGIETQWTERVPVPLAIATDAGDWHAGGDPAVDGTKEVEIDHITELLRAAYLRYSQDVEEHGSSEAQGVAFDDAAQASAERVLAGSEAAVRGAFTRTAERALARALPEGRSGHVQIAGGRIKATLDAPPPERDVLDAAGVTLERLGALHRAWTGLEGEPATRGSQYAREAERDARALVIDAAVRPGWRALAGDARETPATWRVRLRAGTGAVEAEGTQGGAPEEVRIEATGPEGGHAALTAAEGWSEACAWLAERLGA